MIYLDSCILIYAVEDDGPRGAACRERIQAHGDGGFAISPLVVHEVLVSPLRSADQARIEAFTRLFSAMTMIDLDVATFVHAAELRAKVPGLKTPDALHITAARLRECHSMWTNDRRLQAASAGLAIDVIHDHPGN
ncbi:PIN domain-containing protein [Microbacterium sp. C7(2022)]|uniref:type II toxin-antitoxin system VapC family toxin n=1 Tax=Microbacterium sp. C7(2022) TaxID=2992759 RepID=UPI00237A7B62|nr:PIN domain-containing protein [Microbacterium sp. C7(2022)]MDE0545067.1 PIN domain-containing protein [Microbacterium sp. C7(2022)]